MDQTVELPNISVYSNSIHLIRYFCSRFRFYFRAEHDEMAISITDVSIHLSK